MNDKKQNLLVTLRGKITDTIPFWLMRQAGRYLPEYRELRAQKGGFLDMVYDPEAASEITLQPLRRFGMDGAILFSDILVIPQAMGQKLVFTAGEGPQLPPIKSHNDLDKLSTLDLDKTLAPIYQTIKKIHQKLHNENLNHITPIGFAGAPWTIACYMVKGHGSRDFETVKLTAIREPDFFERLIDKITIATLHYLCAQIDAGAACVQLFDSWSGVLDEKSFRQWVICPTQKIVRALKQKYPDVPVIGFPKGAGVMARDYAFETGIDCLGIDYTMPIDWARDVIQSKGMCIQGNLDPVRLLVGGDDMISEAQRILTCFAKGPFIFNLGHGVIKETPIEHVSILAQTIRNFKR